MLINGCSTSGSKNTSKVRLVGVKTTSVIPSTGPVERIYFVSVDDREKKVFWGGYPEKLDVWPGKHVVVVACEWRPTATAPPMSKGMRRVEDTFEAGHIYKFNSQMGQSGECSISYTDKLEY
jgi:hypothetical protein